MKYALLLVLLFAYSLCAKSFTPSLDPETPINQVDGCKRYNWVRVKGKVVAMGYNRITIRDEYGTINSYFNKSTKVSGLHRNDTITVTGIVTRRLRDANVKNFSRRSNPLSTLKITHIEKEGKTLYSKLKHLDLEIPSEYEQSDLNRVIQSEKKRYVRKTVVFTSIGATIKLAPWGTMAYFLYKDDGENVLPIIFITMLSYKYVTSASLPFFIIGTRNYRKAKRTPSLTPKATGYEEVELDLTVQLRPVQNGGGLFLVGTF